MNFSRNILLRNRRRVEKKSNWNEAQDKNRTKNELESLMYIEKIIYDIPFEWAGYHTHTSKYTLHTCIHINIYISTYIDV